MNKFFTSPSKVVDNSKSEMYGYFKNFMVHKETFHSIIEKSKYQLLNGQLDISNALSAFEEDNGAYHPSHKYLNLFEAEIKRVTNTITSQQRIQELSAKALLMSIKCNVLDDANKKDEDAILKIRKKAEDISKSALQLQNFVVKNKTKLKEIAHYADNVLGTKSAIILDRQLKRMPWKEGSNSGLVVVISDIYESIRCKGEETQVGTVKQSGESNKFEMSSTRYRVKEDRISEVLLAAATEVPLIKYGQGGSILTEKLELTQYKGDILWDSLATTVNSIYFDSPDRSLYKARIKQMCGLKFFRVRWYGNDRPSGNEVLFLEMETKNKQGLNGIVQSGKQQCTIREKDMHRFFNKHQWTRKVAKELVFGGNPTLTGQSLEDQINLCESMHSIVISSNLKPCVRSVHKRGSFQSTSDRGHGKLCLHLDRKVKLIDESSASFESWCLAEKSFIRADMVYHEPSPVFEIRSSEGEIPRIFQHLEDRGVLIRASNFSKFLTGVSVFSDVQKVDSLLPNLEMEPTFKKVVSATGELEGSTATAKSTAKKDLFVNPHQNIFHKNLTFEASETSITSNDDITERTLDAGYNIESAQMTNRSKRSHPRWFRQRQALREDCSKFKSKKEVFLDIEDTGIMSSKSERSYKYGQRKKEQQQLFKHNSNCFIPKRKSFSLIPRFFMSN